MTIRNTLRYVAPLGVFAVLAVGPLGQPSVAAGAQSSASNPAEATKTYSVHGSTVTLVFAQPAAYSASGQRLVTSLRITHPSGEGSTITPTAPTPQDVAERLADASTTPDQPSAADIEKGLEAAGRVMNKPAPSSAR